MTVFGFHFGCRKERPRSRGRTRFQKRVCTGDREASPAAPRYLCFPESDFEPRSQQKKVSEGAGSIR
jgi:hypothetical protein